MDEMERQTHKSVARQMAMVLIVLHCDTVVSYFLVRTLVD